MATEKWHDICKKCFDSEEEGKEKSFLAIPVILRTQRAVLARKCFEGYRVLDCRIKSITLEQGDRVPKIEGSPVWWLSIYIEAELERV